MNGTRHQVAPREALIIPRRVPHSYGADADDPWTIWWVHLEGAQLADLASACGATIHRPVIAAPALASCMALIGEAIDHLDHDETLPSLIAASGAAWHLLTTLAEARLASVHDDPIAEAKECLAEDLARPLSMADLSSRLSISASHLTAVFKQRTGYAPMQYRTLLRMQRARVLLDTTDKPIATIAHEVGYDDAAYFSRRFTDLHEQTPRAYRKTVKG